MRVRMTQALPVAVFAPAIQRYKRDQACKCWNWYVCRTSKWTIVMGIRTIHSTFTTLREKRNFTLNAFRHAGIVLNAWFALLHQPSLLHLTETLIPILLLPSHAA